MIDCMPATGIANPARFQRIDVAADAAGAAFTRVDFAEWLERHFRLDPTRVSDVILAINEALANVAEFAYLTAGGPGTLDLCAEHHPDGQQLTVTVTDRGVWRMPEPGAHTQLRGRGIALMRALADRTSIETSTDGTEVRLVWFRVSRA